MPGFNPHLDPLNNCDFETESAFSTYTILLLLTGIAIATYALARYAESMNRLDYENRFARIIAGLLVIMTRMMHTSRGNLELPAGKKLVAIVPHRSGWEALVVAEKMEGTPPRFFATTAFKKVPGVSTFLDMFHAIPVEPKNDNGRSLNEASKVLQEDGCVAIFPQGGFSKIKEEPRIVYSGTAKLALRKALSSAKCNSELNPNKS